MKTRVAILASELRRNLKDRFPNCKFSVRSRNGSMESCIDVYWTDGPKKDDVESIANNFESIDRDQWGEILSGGNRFVFCKRSFSEETKKRIFDDLKSKYALLDNLEYNNYNRGISTYEQSSLIWGTLNKLDLY